MAGSPWLYMTYYAYVIDGVNRVERSAAVFPGKHFQEVPRTNDSHHLICSQLLEPGISAYQVGGVSRKGGGGRIRSSSGWIATPWISTVIEIEIAWRFNRSAKRVARSSLM